MAQPMMRSLMLYTLSFVNTIHWRIEAILAALKEDLHSVLCNRLGVPLVDVRGSLRRAESTGRPAYDTHDVHWTEVGNAIAASLAFWAEAEAAAPRLSAASPGRTWVRVAWILPRELLRAMQVDVG